MTFVTAHREERLRGTCAGRRGISFLDKPFMEENLIAVSRELRERKFQLAQGLSPKRFEILDRRGGRYARAGFNRQWLQPRLYVPAFLAGHRARHPLR